MNGVYYAGCITCYAEKHNAGMLFETEVKLSSQLLEKLHEGMDEIPNNHCGIWVYDGDSISFSTTWVPNETHLKIILDDWIETNTDFEVFLKFMEAGILSDSKEFSSNYLGCFLNAAEFSIWVHENDNSDDTDEEMDDETTDWQSLGEQYLQKNTCLKFNNLIHVLL